MTIISSDHKNEMQFSQKSFTMSMDTENEINNSIPLYIFLYRLLTFNRRFSFQLFWTTMVALVKNS